jgi:hypothetical protein
MSHLRSTCLNCKATRRIPSFTKELVGSVADYALADENSANDRATGNRPGKSAGRPLPLFARPDAGHVIFRGNVGFSLDEAGCVPFV